MKNWLVKKLAAYLVGRITADDIRRFAASAPVRRVERLLRPSP